MTLVVETGAGVPTADALITTAYADSVHDDHGNTVWATYDQQQKESAIRNATLFMSQSLMYAGFPTYGRDGQGTAFPRAGLVDRYGYDVASNAVPKEVQLACAFLALYDIQNAGSMTTPTHESNKILIRKKTGPLEKEYAVFRSDPQAVRPTVLFAMELLAPFFQADNLATSSLTGLRTR